MRMVTLEALATRFASLPERPRVVVSGNFAMPVPVLEVIDQQCAEYTVHALNAVTEISTREGVTAETCFVGSGMRRHPNLKYVPSRLSMVPLLYAGPLAPDVVVLHVSTPRDRMVSLGIEVNVLPAAVEQCRARGGLVVAVVNENMPYTLGDSEISVDDIDLAVSADTPLAQLPQAEMDWSSQTIGTLVANRVPQGATLQTGIGAIPDAALKALTEHQNLRVWTEMFSDGVLALERAGVLDDQRPIVSSFIGGSQDLYDWLDNNPRVLMKRTEVTNDPALIARQRAMTSINTAMQVDLLGQANASRIRGRIYSGFGGQTDFIVGALHANQGQALIALKSWHPRADVSTIVPVLPEPVTSFQQSAIITEQGVAELWGRSDSEQAHDLIEYAAHPDVREKLRASARELGILRSPAAATTV